MKFVCEDSFWEIFPEASIGVVVADGILPTDQVSDENAAKAAKLLDRANVLAQKWVPNTTISKNEVPAVWREAYRKFKTKKGVRSSVENLLKRVLKDGGRMEDVDPEVKKTCEQITGMQYELCFGHNTWGYHTPEELAKIKAEMPARKQLNFGKKN